MKIFVVTSLFPNTSHPINGTFVKEHCDLLISLGHSVTILDASASGLNQWRERSCRQPVILDKTYGQGYALHRIGVMDTRLPRLAVAYCGHCARRLYKCAVASVGKPDLLLAHFSFQAGFAAREIAYRERIPFAVIEHHSLFLRENIPAYVQHCLRQTVRDAAAFICVSESLKQNVERHSGIMHNVKVIPNAIAPIFTYTPPVDLPPFRFFCAGGTKTGKRTRLLIEAFKRAFRADVPVELVLAGPGDDWDSLRAEASSDRRIRFIGRIGREEMRDQFVACHCYVMPSIFETFGIVYREAMAVGRPVISAKNGGIEERWEDGFGILVEKDDVDSLSKALRDMYAQYDRYDGESISQKCLARYSASAIAAQLSETLDTLTKAQ